MALRYIDSMGDHYADADTTLKWTSVSSGGRKAGLHGYSRYGQHHKGMLFGSNTLIMEMHIYVEFMAGSFFTLFDTAQTKQCLCRIANDGSLEVAHREGTVIIARTPPDLVRQNTWYHFGWRILTHPTAGTVELRLNGATVMNLTGIDTTYDTGYLGGSAAWSGAIGAFNVGGYGEVIRMDDLVVMDDVADGIDDPRLPGGGGFTKFIGPVEVRVKRPSGPGLVADWTPTPAVPNHQNVDDVDPDGDATVNTAAPTAVGASDLFTMEDLLPGEDVLAVQSLVLARKTDEGTAALAKISHDGVTTRAGTTVYQPSTYSYMHAPEPRAPDGTLWTAAKWNAMQYGYRRII